MNEVKHWKMLAGNCASDQTLNIGTTITYEPLSDESSVSQMIDGIEEVYFEVTDSDTTEAELKRVLKKIQLLLSENPENRILHNYLYNTYIRLGKYKKAEDLIKTMYERFPDYFFATTGYGNHLLEKSRIKEFEDLFKSKMNIVSAFPDRNEFHISEYISFGQLLVKYFLLKKDLVSAYMHFKMVFEIEIPDNVVLDEELILRVQNEITKEVRDLMSEAQDDPSKKHEMIDLLVS